MEANSGVPRKNRVDGPETHENLVRQLTLCKTRAKQPCCSFRLTENEKDVRMSTADLIAYTKQSLPEENVKNPEELSEFIMRMAEKEQSRDDHGTFQAVMEACVQNLVESVQREIMKFKDTATALFSAFASTSQRRFMGLIERMNEKDFQEKIDAALAGFTREQTENGASQVRVEEIQRELVQKVEETQKAIEKQLADLKESMEGAISQSIEPVGGTCNSIGDFQKMNLDENSIQEVPQLKMKKEVCLGTRGISLNPKNPSQVAILDWKGNLNLFDSKEEKTIQKTKCKVEIWKNEGLNSISFSPDGQFLLATISSDSSLSIYDAKDLTLIQYWKRIETGEYISRASWLNESQIMAAFGEPGVIEVLDSRTGASQIKMKPEETKGEGFIFDIDVSPSKEHIVCAAANSFNSPDSFPLFKMSIANENQKAEWCHRQHADIFFGVKYSACGKYVISGGEDKTLILTSDKDGTILQKEQDWFCESIFGLVFSPISQNILAQSPNELVLIDFDPSSKRMEKKQEIKIDQLDSESAIYSVNICWDLLNVREQVLFIGMKSGSVFKMAIKA